MDGIEVMAVIFAKRLGLSVGTFVMIYNVALYILCGFVIHSWILPLYSIVTYMAALKTVDAIVEGFDRAKSIYIVTTRCKEVCTTLSAAFEQGITVLDAKGFYSGADRKVVWVVLNRFQISRMRELVHGIDPGGVYCHIRRGGSLQAGAPGHIEARPAGRHFPEISRRPAARQVSRAGGWKTFPGISRPPAKTAAPLPRKGAAVSLYRMSGKAPAPRFLRDPGKRLCRFPRPVPGAARPMRPGPPLTVRYANCPKSYRSAMPSSR